MKSYRDLPLRMAEFGSCNRYEPSGALHGIMRVRGFTQDDGHIFLPRRSDRGRNARIHRAFSSESTQTWGSNDWTSNCPRAPKSGSGPRKAGTSVEKALGDACNAAGYELELLEGEGAFYGPKLEFTLTDAIGREWQCGTLQVDPNCQSALMRPMSGPTAANTAPSCCTAQLLGSFERFIGILIEEHAGKLPFWLAPRQVVVASIISDADDYVHEVVAALKAWRARRSRHAQRKDQLQSTRAFCRQSACDPGGWCARGRRAHRHRAPLGRETNTRRSA